MSEVTAPAEGRIPLGGTGSGVPLPPEDDETLVDALCEIRHVLIQESREQLAHKLPTRIRRNLRLDGSAVGFARELVRLCRDQMRLGCLVRWILYLEEGGRGSREVARAAESLLHVEEWEQLIHLLPEEATPADVRLVREELRGHAPAVVAEAFEAARSDRFAPDEAPPDTAWDRFVDLAEMSVPRDGEPPLRVFCSLLPSYLSLPSCGELLLLWGGGRRDRPTMPAGTRVPARLVVHITQSEQRDRYDIDYWTVLSERRGQEPDFCFHGQAPRLAAENLADHVSGLLTLMEMDHRVGHHESVRVELVARMDLLRVLEADRWQAAGKDGHRLGARAEVVYRAEELVDEARADTAPARLTCARRWRSLDDAREVRHLDTAHEPEIRTRKDGRTYREPLAPRLQDDRILVLSVPSHLDECHMTVWAAIKVGVPVVVWRSASHGPGIGPWLNLGKVGREVKVSPDRIRELPKALHESRSGGVSAGDTGYIEECFEVAVFYHDSLPVLPDPRQMTTHSIR